jgi:hypothetical protein
MKARNDQIQPIFDQVDVLLPSIYMQQLSTPFNPMQVNHLMINGTVSEALRLAAKSSKNPDVIPFVFGYYNSGTLNTTLTRSDLKARCSFLDSCFALVDAMALLRLKICHACDPIANLSGVHSLTG